MPGAHTCLTGSQRRPVAWPVSLYLKDTLTFSSPASPSVRCSGWLMLQSAPRLQWGALGRAAQLWKRRAHMEVVLMKGGSVKKLRKHTYGARGRGCLLKIRPGLLQQPSELPCLVVWQKHGGNTPVVKLCHHYTVKPCIPPQHFLVSHHLSLGHYKVLPFNLHHDNYCESGTGPFWFTMIQVASSPKRLSLCPCLPVSTCNNQDNK